MTVPSVLYCKENPIYVFSEKKLRGLSPNFHIHVYVSDLYIFPRSVHLFSCSRIGRPLVGMYINRSPKHECIGIGNEASQFLFGEYISRIFFSGNVYSEFSV
jgi:hypothetical protein